MTIKKITTLVVFIATLHCHLFAHEAADELMFLSALATPKGAAMVGTTYGLLSGIGNFLWAFNWQKHANVTSERAQEIQEAGGLLTSGVSFIFGAMIPLMLYAYQREQAKAATL